MTASSSNSADVPPDDSDTRSTSNQNRQSLIDAILTTVVDGIITIDEHGSIDVFNPAAERMFGYTAPEVVGHNVRVLMPPPYHDEHDHYLQHYQATGERRIIGIGREVSGRRKDGSLFPMELAVSEMHVNGRRMFTGIVRDITERKQVETELADALDKAADRAIQLQQVVERLSATNQELDQFAYIASHDLRAPLQGIRQLAHWIAEDCDSQLPEESKAHLDILLQRVERMETLLADLLMYSRIGRVDYEREPIALCPLACEIAELCIGHTGFVVDIPDSLPTLVLPRIPVELVLRNLFSNAVKHHHAAPGQIALRYTEDDGYHNIIIEDDGPGIDPRYSEQVLEMFRTLKPRDDVEGSGMGLAFVRKTLEHYRGRVSIETSSLGGARIVTRWNKHATTGSPASPTRKVA